jgi:RNA recognition motif-containing protein
MQKILFGSERHKAKNRSILPKQVSSGTFNKISVNKMNIYIGNLSYDISSDDLKEIFEEYGEVTSAKVITDRDTGRSKGFGFVEMQNKEEALEAIDELDGAEFEGRAIRVNEARPKEEKRQGNKSYHRR